MGWVGQEYLDSGLHTPPTRESGTAQECTCHRLGKQREGREGPVLPCLVSDNSSKKQGGAHRGAGWPGGFPGPLREPGRAKSCRSSVVPSPALPSAGPVRARSGGQAGRGRRGHQDKDIGDPPSLPPGPPKVPKQPAARLWPSTHHPHRGVPRNPRAPWRGGPAWGSAWSSAR